MKEIEQPVAPSPHTRYFEEKFNEEKFNRRRQRGRLNYPFICFGLSVSALMILAVIMLLKVTASFTGRPGP
jgi:hypothetical protein